MLHIALSMMQRPSISQDSNGNCGRAGLSYLGMIEPALYVNVAPRARWSRKRAVSLRATVNAATVSPAAMTKSFMPAARPGTSLPMSLG
jgi:hypothetical protein